ncbi:MAG: hypothetical protein GXW85_13295 [Clostridia bacterium]|nr:hypothetical protein [Clostridia bacterium]
MKSLIKRRELGNTGLYVSELSFGAMNLRKLETEEEALDILNYVLDQGVNLIDTARAYSATNSQGRLMESEVLVGKGLKNRNDLKEPIVIVTKGHSYTPEELEENLFTSRTKLGVEGKGDLKIGNNAVILVYLFHGLNEERWATMQNSGVLKKVQEYKREGIVNFIGFSSHYGDTVEIKKAVDTGLFDVVELPYNIFNRSLGEDGELNLLKYIHDKEIGLINMKAFNGNIMPAIYNVIKDFISIDYPTMLNFCLTNPYISTVDAGAMNVEQFAQDVKVAAGPRLTQEEITKFKQEADKISSLLENICRDCLHCVEKFQCSAGIDFPAIMALYSRYTVSEKLGRDVTEFKERYKEFALNASDCIQCGQCVPWCEYKLNIPEVLREAHQAFIK